MSVFTGPFELSPDPVETLRGGRRLTRAEGESRGRGLGGPTRRILGASVPESQLNRGVVIQGVQGAGKTKLIEMSLICPHIRAMASPKSRHKLVAVDVKGDLTASIFSMVNTLADPPPVYLLNPFDLFARALDPHELHTDPTRINQLVSSLTHRKRDARTDEFFDNSGRATLATLIEIMHFVLPVPWTWRDLYHLATSYDLLERVLRNSPLGRAKAEAIVKKTFAGVVATNQSWLDPYKAAFACMSKSPTLRISEFLRGRGVVILTVPENQIDSLAPLAQTLLRLVKDQLLTDNGRDPESQTLIVLDEFAYLPNCVEAIEPLFGRARTANVITVCAWQSWPAVCAAHGEQRMKGIVDNAALRIWMGCGFESALVAERDCMRNEVRRTEFHIDERGGRSSKTFRVEPRSNVLASEIQSLLPPTRTDPTIRAFLCGSHLGGLLYVEEHYGGYFRALNQLRPVLAFRPRPNEDLWLEPWDDKRDGKPLEKLFAPPNGGRR